MTPPSPPGWYPDPEAAGRQWRWWDGAQWAPPGYGYAPAFDPVARAHERAMRADTTRRTGRWFRWLMVALVPCSLLGGIGLAIAMNETFDAVDTPSPGAQFSGGIIAFQLCALVFGLTTWAYVALFIAWLYQAGKFADLQPWPAVRSRTLGAFSPLIPVLNLWWPYEAIRDCFPPGTRPRFTLGWFIAQLVLPAPTAWIVAGTTVSATHALTAVVVIIAGAVLAVVPVLGWRLVDHLDAMQVAHLTP
jgi:hypothetical protein